MAKKCTLGVHFLRFGWAEQSRSGAAAAGAAAGFDVKKAGGNAINLAFRCFNN